MVSIQFYRILNKIAALTYRVSDISLEDTNQWMQVLSSTFSSKILSASQAFTSFSVTVKVFDRQKQKQRRFYQNKK